MSRFVSWFGPIQTQTLILMELTRREMPARLACGILILLILGWHDYEIAALWLGLGLLSLEILQKILFAQVPAVARAIRSRTVGAILSVNVVLTLVYLVPAAVLSRDGSTALLVAAMLWIFGVFAFVGNTLSSLPFYLHSLIFAIFGFATYVLWTVSATTYHPSEMHEWANALLLLVVYSANTVETISRQKGTDKALRAAQDEANARLRALEYQSDHDSLTGLLNRRAFDERLARVLSGRKPQVLVAVFLIDLDGFKPINDTYSHSAGDQVLQEIGRRLEALAADKGLVARLGGDEFVLAIPNIGSERAAFRVGQAIKRAVGKPIPYREKELQVGASIGISIGSHQSNRVSTLCSEADQAMYRAKVSPSRKIILYRAKSFPPRPSLEDKIELVQAFQSRGIIPYYQPKVSLDTGLTFGFEALARWDHPERGVLPPCEFIPRINQLGLQADFLLHITSCVLADLEVLVAEGLDPGEVSVNVPEVTLATLSGRHELDRLLATHPAVLKHLTLEMTEDVFIARATELIQESIAHFRKKGLRVSLDDFGTGFASFQHLGQLEYDELKIDSSFIENLCTNHTTEVLVSGFLNMAKGLGVDVVAEGIETHEQLDRLRSLGCTRVQGYLFGQAMPLRETRIRLFAEQEWTPGRAAQ